MKTIPERSRRSDDVTADVKKPDSFNLRANSWPSVYLLHRPVTETEPSGLSVKELRVTPGGASFANSKKTFASENRSVR